MTIMQYFFADPMKFMRAVFNYISNASSVHGVEVLCIFKGISSLLLIFQFRVNWRADYHNQPLFEDEERLAKMIICFKATCLSSYMVYMTTTDTGRVAHEDKSMREAQYS